jgi:hypothetical protein
MNKKQAFTKLLGFYQDYYRGQINQNQLELELSYIEFMADINYFEFIELVEEVKSHIWIQRIG